MTIGERLQFGVMYLVLVALLWLIDQRLDRIERHQATTSEAILEGVKLARDWKP